MPKLYNDVSSACVYMPINTIVHVPWAGAQGRARQSHWDGAGGSSHSWAYTNKSSSVFTAICRLTSFFLFSSSTSVCCASKICSTDTHFRGDVLSRSGSCGTQVPDKSTYTGTASTLTDFVSVVHDTGASERRAGPMQMQ